MLDAFDEGFQLLAREPPTSGMVPPSPVTMLSPQQDQDDISRPLPAQAGARSNAGDGFALLSRGGDHAFKARCRDQRLVVLVGSLFSPRSAGPPHLAWKVGVGPAQSTR